MTLDEVLTAYQQERWAAMAGRDRYPVIYNTYCLLRAPLELDHKETLATARDVALQWLTDKNKDLNKQKVEQ